MVKKIIRGFFIILATYICLAFIWFFYQSIRLERYWQIENQKEIGADDFVYVALGDSVTQGIGATNHSKVYISLLASSIEKHSHRRVKIINLSRTGDEIEDVIEKQVPQLSQYNPDLVTVAIGGNDLLRFHSKEKTFNELEKLASLLPKNSYIADLPTFDWHPPANISKQSVIKIAELAKNHSLHHIKLHEATRIRYWDLDQYAYDLIHPSDKQHQIWAEAFWSAIKENL